MPKPFGEAGIILGTLFIVWILFWAYVIRILIKNLVKFKLIR